jgi:hypothetical protein
MTVLANCVGGRTIWNVGKAVPKAGRGLSSRFSYELQNGNYRKVPFRNILIAIA